MKTKFFILGSCILLLAAGCVEFPAYEITERPYVNKTVLNMYIGDEAQLKSSPVGATYTWSSDNEAVANVTQAGKVTAVGEGSAIITVASASDKAVVEVRVKTFVPLTEIHLSSQSLKLFADEKVQLSALPMPDNASEIRFRWRSANPAIATVDDKGLVTAIARGVTQIIVASDSGTNTAICEVDVYNLMN
jgi:uncharacterized protein YjdB